jgi:hypothetical protein
MKIKHVPGIRYETYKPTSAPVRPGGEDAYKLPSLVGGERVPYKPPSNGCVGILKDRTPHVRID